MNTAAMDILYVITDLKVGGVPLHLLRLAGAMMARGHRCGVVSLSREMPLAGRFREKGVEVHDCGGGGGWDFRVIGRLARIIEATRPGLVHSLLFHANVASRRAARKVGLPADHVICEIQTVEVERRWHLLIDRWTHRGCRFTIGNSPSVIEHLEEKAGIPRDRLRLVCGGIDPAPLREASPIDRTALGLTRDSPIVLWVGRLDPVKGLSTLIEAFRAVVNDFGAHLLLAGEGPLRETLDRQVTDRGLTERVHLLGSRDDIPGLLKAADVFAFPSRTEGLPNALLEAMAAGCPIVATDVPGCRDLVTDGDTGLLVPYDDTEALVRALLRMLGDRELAKRLGERASEVAGAQWHIERTWEGYAAIYGSILGGRNGQERPEVSTP